MINFVMTFFLTAIFLNPFGAGSRAQAEYIMCWQFASESDCLGAGCSWDPGKQVCS